MQKSFKEFFEKDWVFKASVLCASILWLINAAYNFAARGFTALMIELTVGLLAIIPTLNAIVCIESKTGTYKIES